MAKELSYLPRDQKKWLVTAGLPYANGKIHLGHLVEYVGADIWVRSLKLQGRNACYLCGDDAHGTPIMLRARQEGIDPEVLIAQSWEEHQRDFIGFHVAFDNYHTTHSEENRELTNTIFGALQKNGFIDTRTIVQAYCAGCRVFLADRYIRGVCPYCDAADQYGDACEVCSRAYEAVKLVDPRCAQCGQTPQWRESTHLFLRVSAFQVPLRQWVADHVPVEVANKLDEWFKEGLKDWDITRDAPYFGFPVPGHSGHSGLYFYVWFDAPIGYMAATLNWCRRHGISFDTYWRSEDEAKVFHWIGKDISYFHALFWPALLMGAGFRTPTELCVHGFLTVDGQKMSKSRGTFITAETYLRFLDPQYLRFYFASKLTPRVDDIDLNLTEFVQRVNADLVGKIANIPSRILGILHQDCEGKLAHVDEAGRALLAEVGESVDPVLRAYERRDFSQAMRLLLRMAGQINGYLCEEKPWTVARADASQAACIWTGALNAFKVLATLLQPILPQFGEKVASMLHLPNLSLADLDRVLENVPVQPYDRLVSRIDECLVEQMVEASRVSDRKEG